MIRHITLQTAHGSLHGQLERPDSPRGLILIARSHHAAADATIAANFAELGYATFAMELLSTQEMQFIDATQNVPRLTQRLIDVLDLIRHDGDMQALPLILFASGDVAPAAIRATAQRDAQVKALACHGGLIDRAGAQALELLIAPLLMLFDSDEVVGKSAYLRARNHLRSDHEMHELEQGENPALAAGIWFSRIISG